MEGIGGAVDHGVWVRVSTRGGAGGADWALNGGSDVADRGGAFAGAMTGELAGGDGLGAARNAGR